MDYNCENVSIDIKFQKKMSQYIIINNQTQKSIFKIHYILVITFLIEKNI